ncbi:DUF3806 domain-containing protein [Cellulomonas cellasea]|uniref:DUF3806 domain-containing protein n=1 Tax=Cellulomonas cellasea TaxID=43670 RepID=A0A7W4UH59_9CELL|nr:DUF3806 domain-containing protein [Cellulomonas cellasea]MBB2924081.1 hypothetical protein [Cellulomonas cellasea]
MGFFRRNRDRTPAPPQAPAALPEARDLEPVDVAWFAGVRASFPGGASANDPETLGRRYDDALDAWGAGGGVGDPSTMVDGLGVALGDAVLARVPGGRWAVAADEHGREPAVVLPPPLSLTIFPRAAVARRWATGERGWVADFVGSLVGRLTDLSTGPSPEVEALASFALAHAVHSIVPEGGPLVPFCLLEEADGERSLHRFVGELRESVERARDHARASGAVRAAVAWDGYLTADGTRTDALFVEASDTGRSSVLRAQRYSPVPGRTAPVGEPVTLERGAPLL